MEDAVDALKMAFSVFVFVLALAIVFAMFSQAREVSDIVISRTDNTFFASYVEAGENDSGRVVGIETVIPTLYRYYKEKTSIDIVEGSQIKEKFDEEIEKIVSSRADNYETYKDLYPDGTPWLGNPNIDTQRRVNSYISGKAEMVNYVELKKYDSQNLKNYKNRTFIEKFEQKYNGEKKYTGDDGSTIYLVKGTTKLHITYTL